MEWLLSYSDHLHVKIMSLVYWATGFSSPVVYEVTILPFVWASSILLIYNSSNILFPDSNKIPLLTCLFFFQPSFFLHSTQLLKDLYFTLGFCFLIYDIINHEKLWYYWLKNIDTKKYRIYIHYKNDVELLQKCIKNSKI